MAEVRSCFCGSGFQVQNMLSVVLWQYLTRNCMTDAFLHRFEWSQIVLLKCFLPYMWGAVSAEQTMWWYQAYYLAEAWSTTWPQQLKPFW